jgi:katanin p60 ATPase-containing subunit A1
MIQVMFELARYHAPSTIFLDELDALACHRDASREHEGSRRLKAELLIQLDGLAHSEDMVFFLATSNLPWQVIVVLVKGSDITQYRVLLITVWLQRNTK